MSRYYIIFLFFSLTLNSIAQTNLSTNGFGGNSSDAASLFSGFKAVDYGHTSSESKTNIEGTLYLFKNWNNKSMIWYGDKILSLDSMNYNLRNERFELKLSNDSIFIFSPANNINKVKIGNVFFKPYFDSELQRNSFYEVVWENNDMSLLVKYNLKIKEGSIDPLTKSYITPKQYGSEKTYFILKHNEEDKINAIKLKKSNILKLIDELYLDEVKSFVKKRKLSYKDIPDIKQILTYYYSIKS